MEGKYLITTDRWFVAPNGDLYNSVWGDVVVMSDKFLGITTNRNSTNWYLKVGTEDNHVIVAGCQIHYAVKCDKRPNDAECNHWSDVSGKVELSKIPCRIYFTE